MQTITKLLQTQEINNAEMAEICVALAAQLISNIDSFPTTTDAQMRAFEKAADALRSAALSVNPKAMERED